MAIRSSMDNIEAYLKGVAYAKALPLLLRRYGVDVQVFRTVTQGEAPVIEDAFRSVFETFGGLSPNASPSAEPGDIGSAPNQDFPARILLSSASYTAADSYFASDFNENFIYTSGDLEPGDRFSVVRGDGAEKEWKIVEEDTVGLTDSVFRRFKVVASA